MFLGVSANLTKKIKSTLAHLHVALGHVSNEKSAGMMSQNGAKTSVLKPSRTSTVKCAKG